MMPPEHAARRAYGHFVHDLLRFDNVKFLLDAHMPRSFCYVLAEAGYDAVHTSQLGSW
jgi:hypothetical protein